MTKNEDLIRTWMTQDISWEDANFLSHKISLIDYLGARLSLQGKRSSDGTHDIFDIVQILDALCEKNKLENIQNKYSRRKLKEWLKKPTDEFLITYLAPLLPMSLPEVNRFLNRVLNRSALNYMNPDEYVLYFALNYRTGTVSKYKAFCELQELYRDPDTVISQGLTSTGKQKGIKRTVSLISGEYTTSIHKKESILSDYNKGVLRETFGKHKGLLKNRARTFSRAFNDLMKKICSDEEFMENIKNENKALRRGEGTFQSYSLLQQMREGIATVDIINDSGTRIEIPAGTRAIGESNHYKFLDSVILNPAKRKYYLEVYLDNIEGEVTTDREFAPAGVPLTVEEKYKDQFSSIRNVIPGQVKEHYGNLKPENKEGENQQHQFSRIRLQDHSADESNKGNPKRLYSYIEVETSLSEINEGTKFYYCMDDVCYTYVTRKSFKVPCSVRASLFLDRENKIDYVNWKEYVVEKANTVLKLEDFEENEVKVVVLRPVKFNEYGTKPGRDMVKEDMNIDNVKETFSMDLFVQYLTTMEDGLFTANQQLTDLLPKLNNYNWLNQEYFSGFSYWRENEYGNFEQLPFIEQRKMFLIALFIDYALNCRDRETPYSCEEFDKYVNYQIHHYRLGRKAKKQIDLGIDPFRVTNAFDHMLGYIMSICAELDPLGLEAIEALRYIYANY